MKKRVCSLLVVMAMLLGMIPAILVSAATEITTTKDETIGWYIQEFKNGSGTASKTVEVADGVGYNSSRSLYIKWTTENKNSDWLNLENMGIQSYTPSDRYTVSFRIKKIDTTGTYPDILFGWTGGSNRLESKYTGYTVEEADENGWQRVTASTTADAGRFFQLNIQKPSFEAYIDDFVVTKNGDSTNLLVNGDFEGEESVTIPTHTSLDALEDWTASYRSNYPETSGTREIKTATGVSYTGNKSMYAKFDGSGSNWVEIKNSGLTAALDSNKTYDVSFYIRGEYTTTNNEFTVGMGSEYAHNGSATPNSYLAKSMTFVDAEDPAKAAEGWKKLSVKLYNPTAAFKFVIQGVCEVYIDDFSVKETGSDTNLLTNGDFEGASAVLPDITKTALDTNEWNFVTDKIGESTYTAGVTAVEAQQGKKSLHLTWTSSNRNEYVQLRSKEVKTLLTEGQSYTLEAYVKRVSGDASTIGGWYDWQGKSVSTTTEGEWELFTTSGICANSANSAQTIQFVFQGTQGIDMYIDNMVLKDASNNVVWSEDFETATEGYETSAIKLFDEDMNEITELSSNLDGKTVTGAVAVINYDKANLTGQLMFALYDGYQLKKLILSDIESITTTANGAKIVTVEFTMPEYKDSYKMKAFIWDSIEGMNPLSRITAQF